MALVKVWNDNTFPFTQQFRDERISIPAKDFIEMEYDDAILFKGTFHSPEQDAGGGFKQESYKIIRVEKPSKLVARAAFFKCQACGFDGNSAVELDKHITAEHADILVDEDVRKERIKERGKNGKN